MLKLKWEHMKIKPTYLRMPIWNYTMTQTKAGYKQLPALCINDPLLIAWEDFTFLTLLTAWKWKHLLPRKAGMVLFQVVSGQSFYPLENSLQTNVQKDCCFGCTVKPHIFHLLTVSRQDSWNLVAQGSPSLTMAVVHCVMAFRVSLSLVSFFLQYHSSSPISPRQTIHW